MKTPQSLPLLISAATHIRAVRVHAARWAGRKAKISREDRPYWLNMCNQRIISLDTKSPDCLGTAHFAHALLSQNVYALGAVYVRHCKVAWVCGLTTLV